jgi:hypothetical protein
MKLPEKITYGTETSSGSSMLETKQAINQLIDYLAERDKKEVPEFEGPENLMDLLHPDTRKSLEERTPDIEGIVEEFVALTKGYIGQDRAGNEYTLWDVCYDHMHDQRVVGEMVTDWLRTTLQSQADQYEREKGEMVKEILREVEEEAKDTFGNGAEVVKTIAQKYGVDLSE